MSGLNLPFFELKTKISDSKTLVYDRLRKQYVRLTPEEYVRQHFVNFLIEHRNFPEGLLANEVEIALGNLKKRCDTVVYNRMLVPIAIIEYKSPKTSISQTVFDQIARYNMTLKVPWLMISNGLQHFCCKLDIENGEYQFEKDIPYYADLCIF